ncbi:Rho family guanine nucleotide exchange factor TUS1 NDAI_0J02520 [Naumovozyma dairenensis CBS 421]|uniref:CNH domain-containing protein n=1 Tax=Naumovozyma dairenensis (strain ATCC 10597 / BCRC 20456 / CBS 421 / NBRC 0211 / NRRL Y-12639) TaxID=1071378 RepID=G0WH66_NAUDC|nr:hypothetical protein NDAI_0J02520 [Naumovozyma dairenensis CBS 421]CCD27144.1 hypothetical protein NDAI_0J02520 [Naumovozyma dairenensis CBS 421]
MYRNHPNEAEDRRYPKDNDLPEKVSLPKLPPLDTRESFLERAAKKDSDDLTIGWTPITGNDGPDSSLFSSKTPSPKQQSRTAINSARYSGPSPPLRPPPPTPPQSSSILNNRTRRRPPPPTPSPVTSQNSSPLIYKFDQQRLVDQSSPTLSRENMLPHNNNNIARIYHSPAKNSPSSSTPRLPNLPSPSFSSPSQNKMLPTITSSNKHSSSGEKELPLTPIDFYKPQPLPIATLELRKFSDSSRNSDSIESYYSDSNYSFNNSTNKNKNPLTAATATTTSKILSTSTTSSRDITGSEFNSLLGGKPLDFVPSIIQPTQPFSINLLDENKLYQCFTIYQLSDIYEWILKVYFEWFNEYIFTKIIFYQVVQRLLEFQIPNNFNQNIIDDNVDKIIESLIQKNAIRFENKNEQQEVRKQEQNDEDEDEDTIVIIVAGLDIQGIFTELLPCYSFLDTDYNDLSNTSLKCYSYTCNNNSVSSTTTTPPTLEKKKQLEISEIIHKSVGVWTDYWHLTSKELSKINPKEIQRQSFIFDLIILEERSLNMANAAIEIYGKRFDPDLLPNEPNFASLAFDIFQPLIDLHKTYLLSPIFEKIETNGKFIDGIGKIYYDWCNEATDIYIKYANSMAIVHEIITWEKKHKTPFSKWLNEIDNSIEITKSKMYHDVIFFGGFFKSLQNMPITLQSILKNTDPSMEDYEYLKMVIKLIENLSAKVDKVHGDSIDHRNLIRFSTQLIISKTITNNNNNSKKGSAGYTNILETTTTTTTMSTNSQSESNMKEEQDNIIMNEDKLDLQLNDPGRKLLISGQLLKKRDLWLDPTPVHLVLLDNYLLLTEPTFKNNMKYYKLIERPIPIDYLNLEKKKSDNNNKETNNDDASQSNNNTTNKLLNSPISSTPLSSVRPRLFNTVTKTFHPSSSPLLNENKNLKNIATSISNVNPNERGNFSFKVRNTATNESFTFLAETHDELDRWVNTIINKLKDINKKSSSFNAVEFEILSTDFAYVEKDAPINLPVAPEGSEIDVALKRFNCNGTGIPPIATTILCTTFLHMENKKFLLIATENGVFLKQYDENKKPMTKILLCSNVKKMEVNKKLGLLFVLDDKKLIYFNLPSILACYYNPKQYLINNCVVGLVIKDKVNWFKFAEDFGNSRHLFFERKGRIYVMTPEFDQINQSIKYFKEYKEYRLPIYGNNTGSLNLSHETRDIIVLKKCFLVCTSKGVYVFNDSFNDDGLVIPMFLCGQNTIYSDSTTTIDMPNAEKMLEFVKNDIINNKTRPITCFQLPDSMEYLIIYDEAVIKMNHHGQLENWRQDILVLDFYCTNAAFYNGNLILVGDNLIQVYNVKIPNMKLCKISPVQIIKGKKIQLVSSEKCQDVTFTLSHPNLAERQLLLKCNPCKKQ